ncbi:hypothetical protein HDU93_006778, partial [Gonapodya sp. JEL0774]
APWPDAPHILAGRDLKAGGTWLGISKRTGRWALLTNYRERRTLEDIARQTASITIQEGLNSKKDAGSAEDDPSCSAERIGHSTRKAISRGVIVEEFLREDAEPRAYLESLEERGGFFEGFNVLAGEILPGVGVNTGDVYWYSNRSNADNRVPETQWDAATGFRKKEFAEHASMVQKVSPGVHVLSNALLDTPWPKVVTANQALGKELQKVFGASATPFSEDEL